MTSRDRAALVAAVLLLLAYLVVLGYWVAVLGSLAEAP